MRGCAGGPVTRGWRVAGGGWRFAVAVAVRGSRFAVAVRGRGSRIAVADRGGRHPLGSNLAPMPRVLVYCASSESIPDDYHRLADELGGGIARSGLEVVFGGGSTGLMGSLGRAALREGGTVRGVILRQFVEAKIALTEASHLEVVEDLRPRKARMEDLSDAVIALPGGFGTFEEVLEIIVRKQLGFYPKPIVILNHAGYYDGLFALFDRATRDGFIGSDHSSLFAIAQSAVGALTHVRGALGGER